jgi:hypothetical protein
MKRNTAENPPHEVLLPCVGGRLRLWVDRADGTTDELPEGEFRSGAGRLLFVRRGQCIEIRCPRSKDLFRIHFSHDPSSGRTVANDGTTLETAQFIGVLAPHTDGLDNAAAPLEEFYSANQL